MSEARGVISTYRLQLHPGFGFEDALKQVSYLADLGVSHLYLSPVLEAVPGSMHGYDVINHNLIRSELGGEAGLVALADGAHAHGLGLVIDVVPNHMALPTPAYLNPAFWDTLRLGRDSRMATWFDIDWDRCDGRIGLPLLGGPLADVVSAGELTLGEHQGQPVICYYDQRLPVAPGTDSGSVVDVLSRQHYLLAGWREKDHVLGYRRFFDVDTLVAVKVETPAVFDATHELLLELHGRGIVDGFRIDHPDGLADPEGYLERLREATNGAWVVVEKILEGDESLPTAWATAGTTGYDAITALQTALVPDVGASLDTLWQRTGGDPSLSSTELEAKRLVVDELFQPELHRLARRAREAAADAGRHVSAEDITEALRELLVQTRTYRAYVRLDVEPNDDTVRQLAAMRSRAEELRPDLADTFDLLEGLLLDSRSSSAAGRDLVIRFQQVCGPVMAKGVEDTTFYRYNRMVGLNEVGGDPAALDHPSMDALHIWGERQSLTHPTGMTALSTHDTKRGEDVRARLLAAAEDVEGWQRVWDVICAQALDVGVDEPTAYLVAQTVVGAWPIDADRLNAYLEKAVREAKRHTTWVDPDPDYEGRVKALGERCLASASLTAELESWTTALEPALRAVTLTTKLLQLMLPGVPDVYQGCETVERFLVDPDNRRPVDYRSRQDRLHRLDSSAGCADLNDDKLWVSATALRVRRDIPELVGASATYRELPTTSPHVVGFLRSEKLAVLGTRWPVRQAQVGWDGSTVSLPDGSWTDRLTGRAVGGGSAVDCAQLFSDFPVALLIREAE